MLMRNITQSYWYVVVHTDCVYISASEGHPHARYLGQGAAEKPSTFFGIFMGLSLMPIANIRSTS